MPVWTEIPTGQPVDSDLHPYLSPYLGVDPGLDRKTVNILGVKIGIPRNA